MLIPLAPTIQWLSLKKSQIKILAKLHHTVPVALFADNHQTTETIKAVLHSIRLELRFKFRVRIRFSVQKSFRYLVPTPSVESGNLRMFCISEMQGVICHGNSQKISSRFLLSAVKFHKSQHEMVICRENLLKINRPIIRPICCKFASKQSIVK